MRRDAARALVARGVNSQEHRKQARLVRRLAADQTFEAVFEQWLNHHRLSLRPGPHGTSAQIQQCFRKDILPALGKRSIFDIARADLVSVLARIEARKAFTVAQKCRLWLTQMFRFAMVKIPGLERNPALDLGTVAAPEPPVVHHPYLRIEDLPLLLRALRGYRGSSHTQFGLRLLLLTGVRIKELRLAARDHAVNGALDNLADGTQRALVVYGDHAKWEDGNDDLSDRAAARSRLQDHRSPHE